MLAAVTVAAPVVAVPLLSGAALAVPLLSGAAAAVAGAGARLPIAGHCTPATATVAGIRSGSSVRRSMLPLSTASTTPATGLPLPTLLSSDAALKSSALGGAAGGAPPYSNSSSGGGGGRVYAELPVLAGQLWLVHVKKAGGAYHGAHSELDLRGWAVCCRDNGSGGGVVPSAAARCAARQGPGPVVGLLTFFQSPAPAACAASWALTSSSW
jgi:hypothetical protein